MANNPRLLESDEPPGAVSVAAPLVSIIITNYNYGRFLRDAVNSAFAQAYPNFECIIVDDASTDETPAILADIEASHSAAKVIRRLENGGQLAASLDGLSASKGDYVLFLDADDILLEECIATHAFVNLSLRFPVGFTCSDMVTVTGDRLVRGSRIPIAGHVTDKTTTRPAVRPIAQQITGSWISKVEPSVVDRLYNVDADCRGWPWSQTSGMFFRRDALKIWADMPGLTQLRRAPDGVFARGINALNGSVVIDQPLAVQRVHGANSFLDRLELMNLCDFDKARDDQRIPGQRAALLNEVMRDPQRFNLFDRARLKSVLEAFDTPDNSLDAPDWAKSSRLSNLLVLNYEGIAKALGEKTVISWMRERKIPERVIAEASGRTAASPSTVNLPLLSFVVVNHNYGRFLRACVESIMSQTYSSIECIIVDNASSDDSPTILHDLAAQFPSLKIIYNKENVGQTVACATGFATCAADYVVFVDADDYLLPNFGATHIRAHLSLPRPVGFTSCDMAELVNNRIVTGRLAQFGKRSSYAIKREQLRDIRDVSAALGSDELEQPEFDASLRLVKKDNIDWVWSATSGSVYRSDAIRMFAFNPQLKRLRLSTDCYFNFPINALSGSALIEKPLAVYRIHGENNFTRQAGLDGTIAFKREADEGAKAAFFALEHIVAQFQYFYESTSSPRDLWKAMRTLSKKSGEIKWKWGEHILSNLMKFYFAQILAYLRKRFHNEFRS